MKLRDELRPVGRNRVIDLVRAAGIDVSDWSNSSRGEQYASVNPKYCYNWSFVDPRGIAVLNLWYSDLVERRGVVSCEQNLRSLSDDLRRRGSKAQWIERARKMDDAIHVAAEKRWQLRVIVNDGDKRNVEDVEQKASVVKGRMLDPLPWTIVRYDVASGACRLQRGVFEGQTIDQFDLGTEDSGPTERIDRNGMIFVRSALVRQQARVRAGGKCEFCRTPGFVMSSGQIFIETHHIIPLSEGGRDVLSNVAALCPNHHREAHFGSSAPVIREFLLAVASKPSRRAV